jgi:outer membrane lipoprotein carrier protein
MYQYHSAMRKLFAFLFLLAAFVPLAQAQQDPKAKAILEAMTRKYQSFKVFSASFTQTLENPKNRIKETMQGDIYVSGNKFRLKMKDQEIISNGSTLWTFMKSENEVNISDVDPEEEQMSPNAIFTLYKKGYKYVQTDEIREAGQGYYIIELSPEDKNNPVYKVRLQISKKDNALKSWTMFRDSGNRYVYSIKNFNPNPAVDANFFSFDKSQYKGVKVIDLR